MAEAAPEGRARHTHKILLAGRERLTVLRPMPRKWGCTYAQFKVPIMTQEDYVQNAADSMHLAHRAGSSADKGRLLKLAEAWLDLAERARQGGRNLRRPTILIRSSRES
jgi:hypothetical protein